MHVFEPPPPPPKSLIHFKFFNDGFTLLWTEEMVS